MHYFAYGSNMATRRLIVPDRCPDARAIGAGSLEGWSIEFSKPSRIWSGHAAGIRVETAATTWGVLWELSPREWDALLASEGPAYEPVDLVVSAGAGPCTARTFRVRDDRREPGAPSRAYLAVLLVGAREHHLPPAYVAHLRSFATPKRAR